MSVDLFDRTAQPQSAVSRLNIFSAPMSNKPQVTETIISRKQYQKLVANGERMIKGGLHWFNAEQRLRVRAKFMLPAACEDRHEYAEDLALQAITDACHHLGVAHLLDGKHENDPVVNQPFNRPVGAP
jgi:hypothetical protein